MNKIDIYKKLSTNKSIQGLSKSAEDMINYYGNDFESRYSVDRVNFLTWLVEKDISASSKATIASVLSKYYYVMGSFSKDDMTVIKSSFKAPRTYWGDKALDDKIISKSLVYASRATNSFTAKRNTLSVMLLACFGLRVGQLVSLDVDDVSIKDDVVHLNVTKQKEVQRDFNKNKSLKKASCGYKPVSNIANGLGYYVDRYTKERDELNPSSSAFLVSLGGKRITSRYIQILIKNIGDKMGVALHPHAFRHHVASKVVKKYGIYQTAVLLDHKQITTTQRYLSPEDVDIKEVLNGIDES